MKTKRVKSNDAKSNLDCELFDLVRSLLYHSQLRALSWYAHSATKVNNALVRYIHVMTKTTYCSTFFCVRLRASTLVSYKSNIFPLAFWVICSSKQSDQNCETEGACAQKIDTQATMVITFTFHYFFCIWFHFHHSLNTNWARNYDYDVSRVIY